MSTAVEQWRAVLPEGLAARAVWVATEIAERMRQPVAYGANDHDVIEAAVGIALLHGQLDRHQPDRGWDKAAHGQLAHAAAVAERSGAGSAALCGGLSGLAFGTWELSHGGARYRRLTANLDRNVLTTATAQADQLAANPGGQPAYVIDVISGLAGAGRYLLCRKENEAALRTVLAGLVAVAGSDDGLPRWHIPRRSLVSGAALAGRYPNGYLDCGLAHGVAGPVALLALAKRAGIEVAGQGDAIETMARWLVAQRVEDEWGVNWPAAVELGGAKEEPAHAAWCYGSPGVARALWLTGDHELQELAVSAMKAVYKRPPDARRVDRSPRLCHGIAGLLEITLRFAHDTGDPEFAAVAAELTGQLLAMHEPDRPFGYRARDDKGAKVDQPGLLDGAAGVALTLLAAATGVEPGWDGMLLLS